MAVAVTVTVVIAVDGCYYPCLSVLPSVVAAYRRHYLLLSVFISIALANAPVLALAMIFTTTIYHYYND